MKIRVLEFLISITLICLPLYLIRCSSFDWCFSPIPFTLLEVLILTTFFVWLLQKYNKKRNIHKIIKEIRQKIPLILQILFLIFLIFPAINIYFSSNILGGLGNYKAFFLEPFLFFIVVLDYLSEKKNLKLIFWSLVASGIWISSLAVIEKLVNFSPFNAHEFALRGRASGIFQTSNWVGLLAGPLVVILLGYCLHIISEKKEYKFLGLKEIYWVIFSLILILAGIYSSGSRGAVFGLVGSTVFFFGFISYQKITKKLLKNIVKNIFLALTVFFFIFNIVFLFDISFIIKQSNKLEFYPQIKPRLCLWESAISIIKSKPLTGSGLAGFTRENFKHHTCNQERATYPHNIFLNFWTETGIFGLISFILICSWFFFRLLISEKVNYLGAGFAGFFISLLLHGLVDVPYFKNDLALAFWGVLAICLYLINETSLFTVKVRRV